MRQFLINCIFIFTLFFPFSVYAESASTGDDITLSLHKFDFTLSQDDIYGGVLEPNEFKELAQFSMGYFLEHEGIELIDKKIPKDSLGLVVVADYYRRLAKLASVQIKHPMDININYRDPKLRYRIILVKGKEVIKHVHMDEEDMAEVDYMIDLSGNELQVKDKNHAIMLGRVLAYSVLVMLDRKSQLKNFKEDDFVNRVNALTADYDKPIKAAHSNYIPIDIAANLLSDLKSENKDVRIETLREIKRRWIISPGINEYLENYIKENYKNVGWGETKEVREAMNALASSGDLEYLQLFSQISRDYNVEDAIMSEVVDSLYILRKRAYLNALVHDVPLNVPAGMWEKYQLANRLRSFDPRTSSIAIKEIYRKYRNDDFLHNVIAITLRYYGVPKNYRSELNEDTLAWGIRILGESGNPKFLEVLSSIEEKSFSRKLRKYAEKYRKELES